MNPSVKWCNSVSKVLISIEDGNAFKVTLTVPIYTQFSCTQGFGWHTSNKPLKYTVINPV